ncbi:hypothetical protein AB0I81_22955 [Nonomuraea sp. NPDC050404]|uniref:hypothetical protein n=1 Tax=Nonomuraea sp. NPDC050404 TaxID=3155783 RepID=UPI00341045EF
MPFNTAGQNDALSGGIGNAITHIGVNTLVTAPPTDTSPGTGTTAAATEAAGGSYARVAVSWGAPAGGQRSNSGLLTIDVPAGTFGFLTFWTASTGNSGTQYRGWVPINGAVSGFGTVDAADLTANTVTSPAHGLVNTDRVIFLNVLGGTLPGGLVEGAAYYVVGAATDTFQVSLTSGGAAVDLATTQGELYFMKVVPETFGSPGQLTVQAGALVLDGTGV